MHGQIIRAVDGYFLPAVIEDYSYDRDNLYQHFGFAEIAGFYRETFVGGNRSEPADQKFPADDDDSHPCGHQTGVVLDKHDKGSSDKQLVGQWIEQNAHGRNLPALSRQIPVNAVGDGCSYKQGGGQQLLCSARALEVAGRKDPDQQRDAEDAGERDGVGQVHWNTYTGTHPGSDAGTSSSKIILHPEAESNARWGLRDLALRR